MAITSRSLRFVLIFGRIKRGSGFTGLRDDHFSSRQLSRPIQIDERQEF